MKKLLVFLFLALPLKAQVARPLDFPSLQDSLASAAARGSGVVDARFLETAIVTSEIDVGNNSNAAVVLLLPSLCNWQSSIKNPAEFILKVFNKASVIGYGSGEGLGCVIHASSGSEVSVVCGSDPSNSLYVKIEGFNCQADAGSIVHNGVLVFGSNADESYIGHLVGTASPGANVPRVLWIHSACCSATYENINADAMGASVVPCLFGNGILDSSHAISVKNISCVHPGAGQSNLIDLENGDCNNRFEGIYMERAPSPDTSTPWISIQASGPTNCADVFEQVTASQDTVGSVRYVFDIAAGAHVTIRDLKTSDTSPNAIINRLSGISIKSPVLGGSIANYSTEKSF